ncbi:hypothetical protein J3R30DRAFT_48510 [Lentinula aciculospora]|uniref:C2H2-type domain-containing protein n=1 Tax=Lentinula aciculospora TaxID=153920 RepID=A0A9W9ATJ7_9AGAR|nr:hypothetical protein J3R30DRAFT_48510 [Lentinula aciculospora]
MPKARTLVYQSDGTLKDPTACEFCGARVARPCDLQRHMQKHLRGEERASRSFSCPYANCGFKSLQKSNTDTHIRSVHTKIKDQECPNCEFATADPGSLTRHRKRRHEYVPEHRKPRLVPPTRGNSDIVIVNSGNRYPGYGPSEVPHTLKAPKVSQVSSPASTPTSIALPVPVPILVPIPPKGQPRPPSIAGLLNAPQPQLMKIRPSNLAALLNPLPEPASCRADQSLKMDSRFH